jgi:hypothetical protein
MINAGDLHICAGFHSAFLPRLPEAGAAAPALNSFE